MSEKHDGWAKERYDKIMKELKQRRKEGKIFFFSTMLHNGFSTERVQELWEKREEAINAVEKLCKKGYKAHRRVE